MKLKEKKDIVLDRRAAVKHLQRNTYEGQRPMRQSLKARLCEKYDAGLFLECDIVEASYNGSGRLLVNGQHQCETIVEKDGKVSGRYRYYECESKEELADLFAQFDLSESGRNQAEVSHAFAASIGKKWPLRCSLLCTNALVYITSVPFGSRLSKDKKARLLIDSKADVDFINRVFFAADDAGKKHKNYKGAGNSKRFGFLLRVPVIASAIKCHGVNREDAELFWTSVRDGEMLKESDPIFVLREYLRSGADRKKVGVRNADQQRQVHAKCILAWNAFRTSSRTELRYHANCALPECK